MIKIQALLNELKLTGNTLFIFTSDNGGKLKDHWSAGIGLNLADESKEVRRKSKSAKTTAREMGHKTNLTLREGKGNPYEGGFNVPLIIRWPGKVAAGTSSSRLVSFADFLATMGALFDVKLSEDNGEDSYSFSDLLIGEKVSQPHTNVVLHSRRARSFIDGNWKLVDFSYAINEPVERYELYNLAEDPAESNDLAGEEPERLNLPRQKLMQISEQGNSKK
jgi:arylsulfatase A-like enzyme